MTDIKHALVTSLNARRGVPIGTTWGDFQAAMLQLGVRDRDPLGSIEVGIMQGGSGLLVREDEDGDVHIKELARR